MNLAPLDSSRQAASFFANFPKNFIWKEALWREESNGVKFIAVACLITELWPFKVLKFQTAITPLLSDLERWIWHRWIPLAKQLLLSQKSSKIKKIYFFANFPKNFIWKEALWREESNGVKFIAVACLITQLWPFKVLKFQTAITPLLSDLERWIWHRWIPLAKQLLFLRISQKILFEKKLFDERNPTV
jgi:branched-subunit amino acid transport protein AzlD